MLGRSLKEEFGSQLVSPSHKILLLPDHKQLFPLPEQLEFLLADKVPILRGLEGKER